MAKADQIPAELHVEIFKGDAWEIALDFDQNFSGYTGSAVLHPKGGGTDVVMTFAWVSASAGTATVSLSAAQSAALPADVHSWCLKLTAASKPRTYLAGRFVVGDCK